MPPSIDVINGKAGREQSAGRSGLDIGGPSRSIRSPLRLADPGHPARHQLDEVAGLIAPCITLDPSTPGVEYRDIPEPTGERGLEILDQAIAAHPGDPDLLVAKGCVLQVGMQYASANQVYERVLGMDPDHFEARMWKDHLATWGETFSFPGWDEGRSELHPVMAKALAAGLRVQIVRDGLQKAVAIVAEVPNLPPDERTTAALQWVLSETPQGPLVAYYLHIDPPCEDAFNEEASLGIVEPRFEPREGFSVIGQLAFTPYCFVVLVDQGEVTFNRRIVLPETTALKLKEIEHAIRPPRSSLPREAHTAALQWHVEHFDMGKLVWEEPAVAGPAVPQPQVAAQGPPPLTPPPAPPPVAPRPLAPSRVARPPQVEAPPRGRRLRTGKVIVAVAASVALVGAVLVGVAVLGNQGNGPSGHPTVTGLAVPAGLSVVAAATDSVTIAWSYPAAGGRVDRFWIYRNGAVLDSVTGGRSTFRDVGLAPGTAYRYQVAAETGSTRSALSAAVLATTDTPGLGAAGLVGTYEVEITATAASGITGEGEADPLSYAQDLLTGKGDSHTDSWFFFSRSFGAVVHGINPAPWTMRVYKNGPAYSGHSRATWDWCDFLPTPVPDIEALSLRLRITDAGMYHGEWLASRWEGTFTWNMIRIPPEGEPSCGGSSVTARVVGTRAP